jgi:alcohol dehydrogenase class IV
MERCLGLVVIPTTSGTGSELSNGLVVTAGDGSKILMLNTQHYPEYVIVDPENYAGMPQELTKLVGLDALTHGCESHQTILSNLPSMMISEKVVQMVIEWLPRSVKDGKDLEARAYMAVAASLGGWALTLAAACAGHSFGHVLGAKLHLPHGAMVAYALPFVMEWNARAVPDKVKRIGTLFGVAWGGSESAEEIGKKTRAAIERFVYEDVGLKKFREWGPDPALKDEIAAAIVAEVAMPLTPEQVPLDVVKRILDELYAM